MTGQVVFKWFIQSVMFWLAWVFVLLFMSLMTLVAYSVLYTLGAV